MKINKHHLTYCTNIHPGESWQEVADSLQQHFPAIKKAVSPQQPMGIGLRLSDKASRELLQEGRLQAFKEWLATQEAYVAVINGFPYGGFHRQVVKDAVHQPDWTTRDRLQYTLRLFDILSALLPAGIDGGVSTSPLSYEPWYGGDALQLQAAMEQSTRQLVQVAEYLYNIRQRTGQQLHLDLEPEPDGLLDHTREVVDYYRQWLLPLGAPYLREQLSLSEEAAAACLKDHIQICYDVCHFAVVYEKPQMVLERLQAEGIKVGRIQISAALKASLPEEPAQREEVAGLFRPFMESTYLHQVVQRNANGSYTQYDDLPAALAQMDDSQAREWRTHFHVPVFLDSYGNLQSTQDDILEVLDCLKQQQTTTHLEVETYTWEVLPEAERLPLSDSVSRELQWVKHKLES